MGVSINRLTIRIGGAPIVSDVHIDVRDGQRVGLIGSSGSGKSMIARAMMGLLPVEATVSGSIDVNGEQIVGMQDRDLAALRGAAIGMVFQNPGASLNPLLTVGRQIALPLELHYDLTAEDRQARVLAMMRKVGLDESLIGRHPHELSGGQQQRVGIATALITSPRLIIADEPTTALDSMTQRQIVELLVSLVDEAGAAMLFITHDFSVLAHATQYCYVLDHGTIVEQGRTRRVLTEPSTPQGARLVMAARELTLHGAEGEGGGTRGERAQ
ncbi:ABC transporter ATP-binding protein [Bifidobacterium pseudolongum]|uniref:ABC transporter ATP-binding protein n=1 Tax=Bifidobacterium pseudolongum TaxID=1694 RepID=UPI000500A126|nr:ABC transporter ATP-binding protein [Bifidobacterium pseudolongum]KFI79501.1 dipeptide/oligopeptide/nickel ABC transporter ATPase [Bifidobacterium pseudolongum subsp. pseudolongum]UNP92173.1 ABC transporter ATP-binding protein [Bifidobacterium pseudolongum subsp. pseudolongum]WCA41625.1 ABC transporter ATP-binding protein [Bifidobacterium pseudolongum subsp. pseudolongum]